jgi:hypothetical protein
MSFTVEVENIKLYIMWFHGSQCLFCIIPQLTVILPHPIEPKYSEYIGWCERFERVEGGYYACVSFPRAVTDEVHHTKTLLKRQMPLLSNFCLLNKKSTIFCEKLS